MRRLISRLRPPARRQLAGAGAVLALALGMAGIGRSAGLTAGRTPGACSRDELLSGAIWLLATLSAVIGGVLLRRVVARQSPRGGRWRAIGVIATAAALAVPAIVWTAPGDAAVSPVAAALPVPTVLGHPETCLICHAAVGGLTAAHNPANIGCSSCHAGDARATGEAQAHAGLVRVPGNLADAARTCGASGCHETIVPRIERSIMTTMAGVIATDRAVFGESSAATAPPPHVRDLGASPADRHLRQLCASCHLGQPKTEWGPIGESSRGGGCNACHLVYTPPASAALAAYRAQPAGQRAVPAVHPALSLDIDNGHCFGCHSRSGRIAPAYAGWHEQGPSATPPDAASPKPNAAAVTRQLEDGREFVRQPADVHHERGLDCIDCHPATEVMGAGAVVAHQRDQLRVRCEDCHATRLRSAPATAMDPESAKLAGLRRWSVPPAQRIGLTRSGDFLVNVFVDEQGRGELRSKRSGITFPLQPPGPACVSDRGHRRLSCTACHTAWTPRCTTCHTRSDAGAEAFDHLAQQWTRGAWTESSGPFEAAPPTLGVMGDRADPEHPDGIIDPFAPGMILTIDGTTPIGGRAGIFRRLYARVSPHTIRRQVRSCASCHSDPVALGFGEGTLRYAITDGTGRWQFTAKHEPASDGLPADAWTGFLRDRNGMVSTRRDARPLNTQEQRRVLQVGACLTCHAGDAPEMRAALSDPAATLARRSPRCVIPAATGNLPAP